MCKYSAFILASMPHALVLSAVRVRHRVLHGMRQMLFFLCILRRDVIERKFVQVSAWSWRRDVLTRACSYDVMTAVQVAPAE